MNQAHQATHLLWEQGALGRGTPRTPRLLFGQVREDASVELSLLPSLSSDQRVAVIASAGCLAFALASQTDANVYAIDINPTQIALCNLKHTLMKITSREEFLHALDNDARPLVAKTKNLDSATSEFWKANGRMLDCGLNHSGYVDRKLRLLVFLFQCTVVSPAAVACLLNATSLPEQSEIFESKWKTWRWNPAFRLALSRRLLNLVYGKSALNFLSSNLSRIIQDKVEHLATAFPAENNPYLWQIFLERYASMQTKALPAYLQPDAWSALREKSNLRLEAAEATLWLESQPAHSIHFLALSNILEGLGKHASVRLWRAIEHAAAPSGRIVLRSICSDPRQQQPSDSSLSFDAQLSLEATRKDRSVICGNVFVFKPGGI